MYNEKELEEIHKEIQNKLNNYCQFVKEKNYEQMGKIFKENGILIYDSVLVKGNNNIGEFYKKIFLEDFEYLNVKIQSKNIYEIKGKIYENGVNLIERNQNGNVTTVKGNYFTIWSKVDNEWLIEEDLIPPPPEIS